MIRTRLQGGTPFFPNMLNNGKVEVCLKEDVDKALAEKDKVIDELKNEIEVQKRLRNMALASVPNVLKVMKIIQHHKYKRCLAMAKWCDAQVEWYNSLNEDYSFWLELYVKWHERWLKLAEKFKEALDV